MRVRFPSSLSRSFGASLPHPRQSTVTRKPSPPENSQPLIAKRIQLCAFRTQRSAAPAFGIRAWYTRVRVNQSAARCYVQLITENTCRISAPRRVRKSCLWHQARENAFTEGNIYSCTPHTHILIANTYARIHIHAYT